MTLLSHISDSFGTKPTHQRPLFSVVIPCFNSARYIQRAIDSILMQSIQSFEILIVDDASTDDSVEVISEYTDSRIRLFQNDRNFGQSYARNRAIRESQGEWIAVLDADDWYGCDRLEVLLNFAVFHGADIVADDLFVVCKEDECQRDTWFHLYGFTPPVSTVISIFDLVRYEIGVIKIIAKRDIFFTSGFQYDELVRYGEDFLLYFNCLLTDVKFCILNKPFYYLRRGNTGSLTTDHILLIEKVLSLNLALLTRSDVGSVPGLLISLRRRIADLTVLRDYHALMVPIRAGHYKIAFSAFAAHPQIITSIFRHVFHVIFRRIRGCKFNIY